MVGDRNRSRSRSRGQTTIDFGVGASAFLLAVAFVFAFTAGMFAPFFGEQNNAIAANRVADQLATDYLGGPSDPYVLDPGCTREFFDAGAYAGHCEYSYDGSNMTGAFGLDPSVSLNVTVVGPNGVVTSEGTRLARGPAPPDAGSVIQTQRVVSLSGDAYRLTVRAW
ncbi:MAG: hypothetical protein ABEJ04_02480 [Halobacteriaceae archaeon]